MRKLKLKIADLKVTSFTVVAKEGSERGTVAARLHNQVGSALGGETCDGDTNCTCNVNGGACVNPTQTFCAPCYALT